MILNTCPSEEYVDMFLGGSSISFQCHVHNDIEKVALCHLSFSPKKVCVSDNRLFHDDIFHRPSTLFFARALVCWLTNIYRILIRKRKDDNTQPLFLPY